MDRHQASRCDLTTARMLNQVAGHNATITGREVVSVSLCILENTAKVEDEMSRQDLPQHRPDAQILVRNLIYESFDCNEKRLHTPHVLLIFLLMSELVDTYLTLAGEGQARTKVKGSVFIAYAVPVADAEDADRILQGWWKQHYDATHIGWGRRLGVPPDGEERWDDNGEPHGTTGPPILQAITGQDLWGVLVGVVRYYGGTKLGTGGLVRAYGEAAVKAVAAAPRKTIHITDTLHVTVPLPLIGQVYSEADKAGAVPSEPIYAPNEVTIPLTISILRTEALKISLRDATAGKALMRIDS